MGTLEQNTTLVYGIHIRESANDGSDFSNGATDYRVFYLGEDGTFHLKDSAGTITTPTGYIGTSMPTGIATGDRAYRSDLRTEYVYDGTRWVSLSSFEMPIPAAATQGISASTILHRGIVPSSLGGSDVYMFSARCAFFVSGGTALSASHKWVGTLSKTNGGGSSSLGTFTIDSGSSSVWRQATDISVNAVLGSYFAFELDWVKTGTPGALFANVSVVYRTVAT